MYHGHEAYLTTFEVNEDGEDLEISLGLEVGLSQTLVKSWSTV